MKNRGPLILTLLLIVAFLATGCLNSNGKIYLDDQYYGIAAITEVDSNSLEMLLDEKESFAVFVYQPLCAASEDFGNVLKEFTNQNNITFYKTTYSSLKETSLKDKIKYYPTLVIINKGEIVDFLESDSAEDLTYYKSAASFEEWFTKYVNIKNTGSSKNNEDVKEEVLEDVTKEEYETVFKNVSYDENKVNIYLFWGNGCPHCEHEQEFFKEIEQEYGKYYTLHKFEVWNNKLNYRIQKQISTKMGKMETGVPYTVIGKKVISGFGKGTDNKIKDAIMNEYKNSYDVYFDLEK